MQTNIHMNPCWNADERAIIHGFNAARPNAILNANERAVLDLIADGDEFGLRHQLEADSGYSY